MTNTNDFRRYSYSNDPTYLINGFNMQRGSQAPKLNPTTKSNKGFKLRENVSVKTKGELLVEQKRSTKSIVKVCVVAVISLLMVGLVINSLAVKNQLTKDLAKQKTAIANAQSENISLQSQLDSLVSMSMIDEYAVEQLGMTKVKSNQIQYVDVDEYKSKQQQLLSENESSDSIQQSNDEQSGNN